MVVAFTRARLWRRWVRPGLLQSPSPALGVVAFTYARLCGDLVH